jgi:hypothetical protein
MGLSNIMQRSNSRMVILWVYPMGLSHGSCREVIQEWLSYGFILWVLQRSNSRMVILWVCCPASPCPRHPGNHHTVNPDF